MPLTITPYAGSQNRIYFRNSTSSLQIAAIHLIFFCCIENVARLENYITKNIKKSGKKVIGRSTHILNDRSIVQALHFCVTLAFSYVVHS